MNGLVIVKVSEFQSTDTTKLFDKNGVRNVWLTPIAGKMPNSALVIAGTVAAKENLTSGSTLLVSVAEREIDPEYGRQFGVTNLGAVPFADIVDLTLKLGNAEVIDTVKGFVPKTVPTTLSTSGIGATEEHEESDEEIVAKAKAAKLLEKAAAKAAAAAAKP